MWYDDGVDEDYRDENQYDDMMISYDEMMMITLWSSQWWKNLWYDDMIMMI